MREMIRKAALSVAILGLVSMGAQAQNTSKDTSSQGKASAKSSSEQLGAADRNFVKKATEGGLAEVELGKLASEKASSDEVKKFGQRMVDDHGKANDEIKQFAASKGVTLPGDLNARDKAEKDKLSKLSGEQFDREYTNYTVKDHSHDVAEFRHESKTAKDPDLKSFARQTLPALEEHLKLAKSLAPKEDKEARMEKNGKPSPSKSTSNQ
jgi:putative membrane protein